MDVYKWLFPIQTYTYISKKVQAIVISGYQSHTNNAALIYQHNHIRLSKKQNCDLNYIVKSVLYYSLFRYRIINGNSISKSLAYYNKQLYPNKT